MEISSIKNFIEKAERISLMVSGNINQIAINNMLTYAPRQEELSANIDFQSSLISMIENVVSIYRKSLRQFVFYCWVDEMACQLRISAVPVSDSLPFKRDYIITKDVNEVINLASNSWYEMYGLKEVSHTEDSCLVIYMIEI